MWTDESRCRTAERALLDLAVPDENRKQRERNVSLVNGQWNNCQRTTRRDFATQLSHFLLGLVSHYFRRIGDRRCSTVDTSDRLYSLSDMENEGIDFPCYSYILTTSIPSAASTVNNSTLGSWRHILAARDSGSIFGSINLPCMIVSRDSNDTIIHTIL